VGFHGYTFRLFIGYDRSSIGNDRFPVNTQSISIDSFSIERETMDGEHIRAARALLGWTAKDLSEKAGISYATVQRIDATKGPVPGRHDTIEAIRIALEGAGISFLREGDMAQGGGVCLLDKRLTE
jgi:DNA-binding Xre family transcriptional regulator